MSIVKIKKVWIVTLAQAVLFTFFMINSISLFCGNIYVLFVIMMFVGLMGGAQYVNVIYLIKCSDQLHKTDKELALNMTAMANDAGVLLASIMSLVLSVTCFSKYSDN